MVYQNPGGALNPTIRDRRPGGRGVHDRRRRGEGGRRARPGDAAQGADLRSRQRDAPLLAPALGRHAAARRHRHGAGQGPDAADPRRADHGPRRHGRGRGARPGLRAARGVPLQRPVHQPQPRRDHEDVRPRRRAVRGPAGRGGPGPRGLRRPAPPLRRRAAALPAARRRAQGPAAARHDPRLPAPARRRPAGLRVRRPLRARAGHLLQGGAAVPRPRRRAPQPLPLLGAGARAAARDAGAGGVQAGRPERRAGDPGGGREQDVPPGGPGHPRRRRHELRPAAGRDARPGGRVGQRQDDARPHAARPDARPTRARSSSSTAARSGQGDHQARARRRARAADRLPEPRLGAQPALLRPAHPQPGAGEAARRLERRPRRAPARARALRPLRHAPDQLAAGPALGRAQAARRDRARVRRRAARRRLRRADLGARRLRAGGDPQPARRAAGREGRHLPVHLARPRRRALPVRPHRRALPRPADGARRRRDRVHARRTIPTRRRCCPRCRRSTGSSASGSGSRARSRATATRRPAASSTPAARATSATSAISRSPSSRRSSPGHFWRCHYSVEELRELQATAPEQRPAADPAARSRRARRDAARGAEADSRARAGEQPPPPEDER